MDGNIKINWHMSVGQSALVYLTGANLQEFFLDSEVCREVNDRGRIKVRELFGNRLRMPSPSCAGFSYGHLTSIGAKVRFPENSEPNVEIMFSSLKEGIKWLKREFDFSQNEFFKSYYNTYLYLKESFPDENVSFSGYTCEGPLTTAVLLRGQDFYMDLYDEPELAREFLELVTDSTIKFRYFLNRLNGLTDINPDSSGMADDFASLVTPWLWPEFVVPYWKKYYEKTTSGKRNIHVENLAPDHLKYLEETGISFYDPSVSAQLSPKIICQRIKTDFTWRLASIYVPEMTAGDVEKWVYNSVREGARHLHSYISNVYCRLENQNKAKAFMDACERIQENGID